MFKAAACCRASLIATALLAVASEIASSTKSVQAPVSTGEQAHAIAASHGEAGSHPHRPHHRHHHKDISSIDDAPMGGQVAQVVSDGQRHHHKTSIHNRRINEGSLVRRVDIGSEADIQPKTVREHTFNNSGDPPSFVPFPSAVPSKVNQTVLNDTAGAGKASWILRDDCARLIVGTWWFSGESPFREFRLWRDADGAIQFRQVWGTSPYKRIGKLEQLRPEVTQASKSGLLSAACAFQANLSDGDQIHVFYHLSNSRIPETLEVAPAHNLLQPVLALRRPSPWVHPDTSAVLIAAALLFTGVVARCWPLRSPCADRLPKKNTACSRGRGATSNGNLAADQAAGGMLAADQAAGGAEIRNANNADAPVLPLKASICKHELGKQHERVREEWLDSLRITCIAFMVIRHALQSLERLGRLPAELDPNTLAFFLHGLPIFLYIAGRSCGTSMPPQGISMADQLRYLRRRAVRLLIPDLLGAVLVVVPTEYIGRAWRPCAMMGLRDGFLDWLAAYLFDSDKRFGLYCEGLGWLGFLITLFCVQAMVYPWASALHLQILSRPEESKSTSAYSFRCCGCPALWLVACLSFLGAAANLDGDVPMLLRGVFRPDVALVCAPFLADMLMVQAAPPGAVQRPAWRCYFWVAAVLRRIAASTALATFTLRIPFDRTQTHSNNSATLWTELLCFMIFYQQGILDGILKTAAAREQATGNAKSAPAAPALPTTFMQKVHARSPWLRAFVVSAICWGLFFLVSLMPVPGMMAFGAGYRYPAYRRASAGHFVFRSWAVLGLAIWWWSRHLPAAFKRMSGFAELGFSFYFLHWLFIEFAMLQIYGKPAGSPLPRGDMPWWAALTVSLFACCLGVCLCHALLLWLVKGGLRCYQSPEEFVIVIKTTK